MQNLMPEWYKLDDATLRDIFTNGMIVLDANILLQLYKLGEGQRNEIMAVLSKDSVRRRVWVPYQVALEFQKNRLPKAREQIKAFQDVENSFTNAQNQVVSTVQASIKDKSVRKAIVDKVEGLMSEGLALVSTLRDAHVVDYETVLSNDPIRQALDELLSGSIPSGPAPSPDVLAARTAEAVKQRFPKRIPPGYCDAEGPDKKINPEGDYLIWAEIKDRVLENPGHVLMVTNDMKEDWYLLDEKKNALGPRPELRREFSGYFPSTETYHYHQESLEGFLWNARKYLSADVDDATLETIRSLEEEKREQRNILSKLRHPSQRGFYDIALQRYPTGSAAHQHLRRALAMIDGSLPFDADSANAALLILKLVAADSPAESDDEILAHVPQEWRRAMSENIAETIWKSMSERPEPDGGR